jgi:hypothetical protein
MRKLHYPNEHARRPAWVVGTVLAAMSGTIWFTLDCAACSSGQPPNSARSSGAEAAAEKPAASPTGPTGGGCHQ